VVHHEQRAMTAAAFPRAGSFRCESLTTNRSLRILAEQRVHRMSAKDEFILEILFDVGLISHEQEAKARAAVQSTNRSVVEELVATGDLSELDLTKALANQYGMDFVTLAEHAIPDDVIQMIPRHVARRYRIVPLWKIDSTLTVAISDPMDMDAVDSLRYLLKGSVNNVEPVVALRSEIDNAISRYYGSIDDTMENIMQEATEANIELAGPQSPGELAITEDQEATDTDAPIIKLVSMVILDAFRSRASDIHMEPLERKFRIRYRIDGVLQEVESPPKRLQPAIISRVKIMANLSIAEKRVPQDGRIRIPVMGRTLDLRVSSIPTVHGESIVMRILDKQSLMLGLPQLGFFTDDQATFERLITLPDGIILVTGPTGSGKTTTLYACLHFINRPDRKIITVEDPVEYELAGINQVHVNSEIGLTFASALRSILRQAPNVIMIGEIRDLETANIAVNASLTGHLVFSTLHTNDAPSAITRMLDIGVKPFLIASSLRAIMAQRLVRKVCNNCKQPYQPTDYEMHALNLTPQMLEKATLFRGVGCSECKNLGYRGRMGIFEILVVDEEIRRMIYDRVSSTEIRKRGRELGMRTLREDGVRKVLAGITTPEEVLSITQKDED
jgi:general secretion pathway protein E/type IV pilus assembly protein PilB